MYVGAAVIVTALIGRVFGGPLTFNRRLTGNTFLSVHGVSLSQCRSECNSRIGCRSINYQRLVHICELNTLLGDGSGLVTESGWVYIGHDKMNVLPINRCALTEVYASSGSCVPFSCPVYSTPAGMDQRGNMNTVGARVILTPSTKITNPYKLSEFRFACSENGDWVEDPLSLEGTCQKLFRGEPRAGGDIYEIWKTGTGASGSYECFDRGSCPNVHYWNTNIHNWTSIPMTTLRFSVFKDGSEAQYIIFNSTDSDALNWFSPHGILRSSWTSLPSPRFLKFSIEGYVDKTLKRRFYICSYHNGCERDILWFSVSTNFNGYGCNWDNPVMYGEAMQQSIIFSELTDPGNPLQQTFTSAESFEIAACF